MSETQFTGLQLTSTLHKDGQLALATREITVGPPGDGDVIVRVEASPINPSDLGLLLGGAELDSGRVDEGRTVLNVPENRLAAMQARFEQELPCGNEGAGIVVAAGSDPDAQALMGRTVALLGGSMYAQYRKVPANACLVLNEGTDPADAASCFVNPLTALGMVDTMRMEGHTALVHTAAASNLGQMLQKICINENVPLVNVVRRPEQAALMRDLGATYVVDSSQDNFRQALVDAIADAGATLCFDATGGGRLASDVLAGMESALQRQGGEFNRYGSSQHKQVYIYGGLDTSPTTLNRAYGMAWGIGGWLLPPFLAKVGQKRADELRQKVADELHTTFASSYSERLSLAQVLDPQAIARYGRMATGEKALVVPQQDL